MKKIFAMIIAIVVILSFSSIALAGSDWGSWTSNTCMNGFTASNQLTKPSTAYKWDHFYPRPQYVRFAIDNYASDDGWLNAYVKTPSGTRMSSDCVCCNFEDDNVAVYSNADAYNTLSVRIENCEYPGQYNMRSAGSFDIDFN